MERLDPLMVNLPSNRWLDRVIAEAGSEQIPKRRRRYTRMLETDVGPDGLMEPGALAPPPVQVQPMAMPLFADVGARGKTAAASFASLGVAQCGPGVFALRFVLR